jgi:hypothetical protein
MGGTTNFPGGLSSQGVPLIGEGIGATFGNTANAGSGRYFFVNPTTGSNGNTGLTMNRPFETIAKALSVTISNNHDTIVLSASSGHTQTTEIAVTGSRTHFLGLDAVGRYLGARARVTMGVTTGTGIAVIKNTGVGNTFIGIKIDSADTLTSSKYAFADGGEYTRVINCEIVHSGQLGVATAAPLLMNGDSAYYSGCAIGSLVHIWTDAGTCMLTTRTTISGKVSRDSIMENCMFLLKTTSNTASAIHVTTATDVERMLMLKNCQLINAKLSTGTQAKAIILDNAQTDGFIICDGTFQYNFTSLATTASGVLAGNATVAAGGTAGDFIAATS